MNQILIFATTLIIQFIITVEMNMMGTLAPFFVDYFNIRSNLVILFNLGFSAVGIFVPYLGILADRFGKKKILKLALLFFLAGCLLAGLSSSPLLFAMSRMLIGLGYFSLSGTNLAYISEFISYENRGKASGALRIAFGVATILTPLFVTSQINRFHNLSSVYYPIMVLGIIAFLLLLKLPETVRKEDSKFDIKKFLNLFKEEKSKKILLSVFFISTSPTLVMNFLGIYLVEKFNLTQNYVGLSYTIIAIGTISGILLASVFTDRVGKLKFSKAMFILMVLSVLPMLFLKAPLLIVISAALFAIGIDGGWTAYQTYATEISPENRGTFMNLFYTMNALTVTFYSIVGSFIYSIGGFKLAVILSFIISSIGVIIINSLSETTQN